MKAASSRRSLSMSPRADASQAPTRFRSRAVIDSTGKWCSVTFASSSRFVFIAHSSRARQTDRSSGRRRRQASIQRAASSWAPTRIARLARPSQIRSSSGAILPTCSRYSRTDSTGGTFQRSSICRRARLMACSDAPSPFAFRCRHRVSISREASSPRPCWTRVGISNMRRPDPSELVALSARSRMRRSASDSLPCSMSRSIRSMTARPLKGESGGTRAQAASASFVRPRAFSQEPSK